MMDVWEKVKEDKEYLVLPKKFRMEFEGTASPSVLLLVHLHYEDTLEFYLKYIDEISDYIDVLFTTSSIAAEKKLADYCKNSCKNVAVERKKNRGRDVSSFLVTARERVMHYKYVCFVHDKKGHNSDDVDDTKKFIEGLLDNTLGSREYVDNIIGYMENDNEVGLLVPPLPFFKYLQHCYGDTWYVNYANSCRLAEYLGLNIEISWNSRPLSLGSVFWARTDALKKLLEIEWSYDDFEDEPMKEDGSLSHAIERIIPYVVCDAGYKVKMVASDKYIFEYASELQQALFMTYCWIREEYGIYPYRDIENRITPKMTFLNFMRHHDIYIFGARKYGRLAYEFFVENKFEVKGFVVTSLEDNEELIDGLPVLDLEHYTYHKGDAFIIGVRSKLVGEVVDLIKERFDADCPYMVYNEELVQRWDEIKQQSRVI